jgi:hypothetical protein
MKKKTKKLVLAKETVRSLENGAMGQVAGGTTSGITDDCNSFNNSQCRFCLDEGIGAG